MEAQVNNVLLCLKKLIFKVGENLHLIFLFFNKSTHSAVQKDVCTAGVSFILLQFKKTTRTFW